MQTVEGQELIAELTAKARREGRDLWDVMESDGFMLTRVRSRQVKSETLSSLLWLLRRETPERLLQAYLGGRPATAADMFGAMLRWLEDYQEALGAGYVG